MEQNIQKRNKQSSKGSNENFPDQKSRYDALLREKGQLDQEIAELQNTGITTDLKPQMNALHEYNEMKDLTQMVIGYLSNTEQCSIVELYRRYGLPTD